MKIPADLAPVARAAPRKASRVAKNDHPGRSGASPARKSTRTERAVDGGTDAVGRTHDEGAPDEGTNGVGTRLRFLRESHGLSMRELARRAGLNHGTVGAIEKDTISPSVGSLRKILDSFPITLSEFFAIDLKLDHQVFFRHAELLEVGGNGVSLKQVGHNLKSRPLQILLEQYEPGAETAGAPYSHAGEEGGVVVQGTMELTVGGQVRLLGPGDAYLFPSRLPHRFRNAGDDRCVIVSANTPPV